MPTFRIPMPDGRTAVVGAPHGATRRQAAIAALRAYHQQKPAGYGASSARDADIGGYRR
jgi:hypothetical protein